MSISIQCAFYVNRDIREEMNLAEANKILNYFKSSFMRNIVGIHYEGFGNRLLIRYRVCNMLVREFMQETQQLIYDIAQCYKDDIIRGFEAEIIISDDSYTRDSIEKILNKLGTSRFTIGRNTVEAGKETEVLMYNIMAQEYEDDIIDVILQVASKEFKVNKENIKDFINFFK